VWDLEEVIKGEGSRIAGGGVKPTTYEMDSRLASYDWSGWRFASVHPTSMTQERVFPG
jgi:hypothetical protein